MAIEKLKRHKSPGIDQLSAELIKAGGRTIPSGVYKRKNSVGIRGNCLRSGRSQSLCLFIWGVIKQIVVIIEANHFCKYIQNFIQHPAVKVNSIFGGNFWVSSVWFSTPQINY
jgi:hypothetical protein